MNIPLSILPSLAAPGHSLVLVCASAAHLVLLVDARGMLAEVLQISVHLTEAQIAVPDPAVNGICDLAESFGVAAFETGFETADNEEIAMDHFVVTPIPCNTAGKTVAEEEFVCCREDAAEGVVVQGEVGGARLGVDKSPQNTAMA
ncbi:hypothetical protein HG530_004435 [Fusarium avenaceum]|nr:hypothetical protein HG530_004435 [Fusarium avenaceum]